MYFIKKTKKLVSFVLIVFFTSLCIFLTSNTFAQNTSSPFHWDYINVDINVEDNKLKLKVIPVFGHLLLVLWRSP